MGGQHTRIKSEEMKGHGLSRWKGKAQVIILLFICHLPNNCLFFQWLTTLLENSEDPFLGNTTVSQGNSMDITKFQEKWKISAKASKISEHKDYVK